MSEHVHVNETPAIIQADLTGPGRWKRDSFPVISRLAAGQWYVMFGLDLEAAFAEVQIRIVARIGMADDTYLFGSLEEVATARANVETVLQEHGHEVQTNKSSVNMC